MADIRRLTGTAGELHAQPMPTDGPLEYWVMEPTGVSLVKGSAQVDDTFDLSQLAEQSIELAGRRSGGGAVFIDPASVLWIDVVAPRDSEYWSDDLGETFLRVGSAWKRAFASLGLDVDLFEDRPTSTPEARLACWAGVGWGELTWCEQKVLGLSQRRTRWGARIQAMAVLDESYGRVAEFFRDAGDRQLVTDRLGRLASFPSVNRGALERAVLAELG